MECDYLVVGAGFFGCVIAERIANDLNAKVLVIDKRPHIGGNCYSEFDNTTGIEFHKYGTHIFHTSSKKAWDYIIKFTEFNGYHHQVLTTYKNKVYQMPINLETINAFYNLNMKPFEAKMFLKKEIDKESIENPRNFEEAAISSIGRPLYEAFIKSYTIRQWQKDPKELPVNIFSRLPVRFDYMEDYFKNARWQGIPLNGYTNLFESLLGSPNIKVELNCDFFAKRKRFYVKEKIVYSGAIDRFFDYKLGKLEWRSIVLDKKIIDVDDYQGTSVMNYADLDVKFTRIHEPRHLHSERQYSKKNTILFYETSTSDSNDPYYPINTDLNQGLIREYKSLAKQQDNVIFGGRLGDYAYYDMDKTILAALKSYEEKIKKF